MGGAFLTKGLINSVKMNTKNFSARKIVRNLLLNYFLFASFSVLLDMFNNILVQCVLKKNLYFPTYVLIYLHPIIAQFSMFISINAYVHIIIFYFKKRALGNIQQTQQRGFSYKENTENLAQPPHSDHTGVENHIIP